MTRSFLFLLIVACVPWLACSSAERPDGLVIRNVALVDVRTGGIKSSFTIDVRGDSIYSVTDGAADIDSGRRVVDATGMYVIPGLWDMHVHLTKARKDALPVMLAAGITSVRDMGSSIDDIRTWRSAIERGELPGPRILTPGPMLEAPATLARLETLRTNEPWHVTRVTVPDSAAAEAIVDSVAALGVDFIKIRESPSLTAYRAVVAAARARGLNVAGHPPYAMDPVDAAALGMTSFEHGSYPYPLSADSAERTSVLTAFESASVAIVPTLVAWQTSLMDPDSLMLLVEDSLGRRDPRRRLVSDFLADEWRFDVESDTRKSDQALRGWTAFFDQHALDLSAMHDHGIAVLPGTDLSLAGVFPGYSLHDELELFVTRLGMTTAEAMRSATIEAAGQVGLGHVLGTIEKGKLADMVLLGSNPLEDIEHTRDIRSVIKDGVYHGPEELGRYLDGLSMRESGSIELMQRASTNSPD